MEPYEYQTLFEFENNYWWYRHLHAVITDSLLRLGADQHSRIMDAGCGTGKNIHNIREKITKQVFGFDFSKFASPYWGKREITNNTIASINQIPFESEQFDFVICADVLESEGVDETVAIAELIRLVKIEGYVLLIVPAYDWLMTTEHHQAVHAIRRYTAKRVHDLFQNNPQVNIVKSSYFFTTLFPLIALYRLWLRIAPVSPEKVPHSELTKLPDWINSILNAMNLPERLLLRAANFPYGSSIFVIAKKI